MPSPNILDDIGLAVQATAETIKQTVAPKPVMPVVPEPPTTVLSSPPPAPKVAPATPRVSTQTSGTVTGTHADDKDWFGKVFLAQRDGVNRGG